MDELSVDSVKLTDNRFIKFISCPGFWRFVVIGLLLLCAASLFISTHTFGFAVELDGEEIGKVKTEDELHELLSSLEDEVSSILGYDYALEDRVSYHVSLESREGITDSAVIEKVIYESIDEVDRQFVITVDGTEIGSVSDLRVLQSAMDEVLEGYSNENTISAEFLAEILYEYTYADRGLALEHEEILSALSALPVQTIEEVTYTEIMAYDTEYIDDDTMYAGENEVVQSGVSGENVITAKVIYLNGEEQEREILSETVVSEPFSEIISRGTAEKPLTASTGSYIWPVAGTVSSHFGVRNISIGSSDHKGLDIAAPNGEYIYAADGGEVIFTGESGGYGNLVKIQHDNGDVTYYGHCSSIDVEQGELVYQGQLIARVGMTGTATGNHLHFEVRIDDKPVNPLDYLP